MQNYGNVKDLIWKDTFKAQWQLFIQDEFKGKLYPSADVSITSAKFHNVFLLSCRIFIINRLFKRANTVAPDEASHFESSSPDEAPHLDPPCLQIRLFSVLGAPSARK